jgi:hypothetical protein
MAIFNVILILGAIFLYQNLRQYSNLDIKINRQFNEKLPNIILFSAESLEEDRMSVYGAMRDTTPNLFEFAKSAIIFNQAYPNQQNTRGSIASILTGKSPATTKVFADEDILIGRDSFQHLPGILKKLGYYCASLDFSNQPNPVDINMLNGFDEVNGAKTCLASGNSLLKNLLGIYPLETYFLRNLFLERIYYKVICLFGIKNKFQVGHLYQMEDRERICQASNIISQINRPLFIQIHLGSTKARRTAYTQKLPKKFSFGNECVADSNDCYDDALFYIDNLFGELLDILRKSDSYNQTMILFLADHNRQGSFGHLSTPVPLIIKFPGASDIRNCDYPVQYLDIAPSILELLHVSIPDWMEGAPILYPKYDLVKEQAINRPIFTFVARHLYNKQQKKWLRVEVRPPLYGIQEADMVVDKYLLKLDILSLGSELYVLQNHKHILFKDENRSKEYLATLLKYLKNKGFLVKE